MTQLACVAGTRSWTPRTDSGRAVRGTGTQKVSSRAPSTVLLGVLMTVLALPGTAMAYEDQLGGSLSVGLGINPRGARPVHGAFAEAGLSLGLDDVFSVRTRLTYAFHPAADDLPSHHLAAVASDLIYLLDILTVVPYFGAGLSAQMWTTAGDQDFDAGVQILGGLDYLYSREWIFGIEARGVATFRALKGDAAYVTVGLTATRLWDF